MQKDYTTVAGRTSESREAVNTGEERSPGCTTVRETRSQRHWGNGSGGRKRRRRFRNDKEELHWAVQGRQMEEKPFIGQKVGIWKKYKRWRVSAERLPSPCHHQWLSSGGSGQMWRVVSGEARSRRGHGPDARHVRNAGC